MGWDMISLEAEAERLQAENARLRAALEAVEWVWNDRWELLACPWCDAMCKVEKKGTHESDCQRQAALGDNMVVHISPEAQTKFKRRMEQEP